MRLFLTVIATLALLGCKNDQFNPEQYFNAEEKSNILQQIVTHVYVADGIPAGERFDEKHKMFYKEQLPQFSLFRYYKSDNGEDLYYIIRPARDPNGRKRGVGGKLKLNGLKISSFQEVFVTPLMTEEEAKTKGEFLFRELVKNGNVDEYIPMRSYIQWPNDRTMYDTTRYEWVGKRGE